MSVLACNPACDPVCNFVSCCNHQPCGIGEGDCDSDDHCQGDLVCGVDNCKQFDPNTPRADFDCCMKGKAIAKVIATPKAMVFGSAEWSL